MIRIALLSQLIGRAGSFGAYLEPLLRVAPRLAERGIRLTEERPDVVLVDCSPPPDWNWGGPLILFDPTDGAMLWWYGADDTRTARHWLGQPQVLGVLKLSRYRSRGDYDVPWIGGALHMQRIHDATDLEASATRPAAPPSLSQREFERIAVGPGFWAFAACDACAAAEVDFTAPRPIDVVCVASTDYVSAHITNHRRLALERVLAIPDRRVVISRGRLLSHEAYVELLTQSRICVCPWGWGETTIRDYEAMLAGCVVIKPRTEFVELYPEIDERHYVACADDFADLPERVEQVLAHWPAFEGQRFLNRQRLLAARELDALAELLAGRLHGSLNAL
jgi:hypothetical protein